jgi:hypothetical protein
MAFQKKDHVFCLLRQLIFYQRSTLQIFDYTIDTHIKECLNTMRKISIYVVIVNIITLPRIYLFNIK